MSETPPAVFNPLGTTRSVLKPDHALLAPASHVPAPLPGWTGTQGIVLIAPAMGARFTQFIALMDTGGTAQPALCGVERFAFVLDGHITVDGNGAAMTLGAGGYAYLPPGAAATIRATEPSRVLVLERRHTPLAGTDAPGIVTGQEQDVPSAPFLGDPDAQLKLLLPDNPSFDMAVNIFTYAPGAALPFVEMHVMEHGLLMLAGAGMYRLSDSWYPVQAGDTIWMAAFCPQWFVAMGKTPARYIYYKDINRGPLLNV